MGLRYFGIPSPMIWILAALVVWALVPCSMVEASPSDDLNEIEQELETIEGRLSQLRGKYVRPLERREGEYFNRRYARGLVLHREKDYVHSSIIFGDLTNYPDVEKHREYYNLIWYYADSLARNKNFGAARTWLEKVVDYGEGQPHFKRALVRLIDISVELGRLEEAETYYRAMSRTSGAEGYDVIQYAFAKSLYRKGNFDRALRTFKQIPADSDYYSAAQYFAAAILVDRGEIGEAFEIFTSVYSIEPLDERQRKIQELAYLAAARILFEQEEYEDALSLYRNIGVESEYFDQAYYEVTWIYIKNGKFAEAANTLDMLLLALPNSLYAPNSQVLKGNILLWEGKYKDSAYSFQTVINKYTSVVDTLDGLVVAAEGKHAQEIQTHVLGEEATLPKMVVEWFSQEEEVADALVLSSEVRQSEIDAEDSGKIIDALKLHLSQSSKANIFPKLREGRDLGIEIEHNLTTIRKTLVDLGSLLVGDSLLQQDRKRLGEVQSRRRELEELYLQIPKTAKERIEQRNRHILQMEQLDQTVYQLKLQLKGIDEMMASIMTKHEELRGDPKMSQNYLARVKSEVAVSKREILDTISEVEKLQVKVWSEIEQSKIGDESLQRDEAIRHELDRVIAEEKEIVSRMRSKLSGKDIGLLDRIENAKQRSDRLESAVQKYFYDMESLVSDRVGEFIREVEGEERRLAEYRGDLMLYRDQVSDMAAEIAFRNLQAVRDQFFDVVLKANVGLVDIAWERRDRLRKRIDKILEKRSQDKEHLTKSFKELRGE